jgi:hypothetical protein
MRRAIETAPKDGKVVIIEDDRGTYEHAHWSTEAQTWVKENGEISKITPTHWLPTRRDEYLLQDGDEFLLQKDDQEHRSNATSAPRGRRPVLFHGKLASPLTAALGEYDAASSTETEPVVAVEAPTELSEAERRPGAGRRFAIYAITAVVLAASLLGAYFRAEVGSYVARFTGEYKTAHQQQDDTSRKSTSSDANLDAVEPKQTADGRELRQSLQKERERAEALADELANARRDIEAQAVLASKMSDQAVQLKRGGDSAIAELQLSLQKERERAEALATELSMAKRDAETWKELANKAGDNVKPTASATESRQSVQKERDRSAALANELAKARRELETQKALTNKSGDDTAQLKQAAASAIELRQSLQKERDRAEALAGELGMTRRELDTQKALANKSETVTAELKQTAATAIELRQALQSERGRTEALASELEAQGMLVRKAGAETAQIRQAAESAIAELRQSLEKQQERAEALAGELATARREAETQKRLASRLGEETAELKQAAANATELRQAAEKERERAEALTSELEVQTAVARQTGNDTAQVKEAAQNALAELRQSLQKERERAEALASDLATVRREAETELALASTAGDRTAQDKLAQNTTSELRQSLQTERDRAAALESELLIARREAETQRTLASKFGEEAAELKQATANTIELKRAVQQERERAEALRSKLESQTALAQKTGDEAAQIKQAADSATAELQQSLQKERARAEGLVSLLALERREVETQIAAVSRAVDEAAKDKRTAESATVELRQNLQKEREAAETRAAELAIARREAEAQAALASKSADQATQEKRIAESATAELQQLREKTDMLAKDLATARREVETQVALASKPVDELAMEKRNPEIAASILSRSLQQIPGNPERVADQGNSVTQAAAKTSTGQQPAAIAAPIDPEVARLLARASALLSQGDIGSARVVLERGSELGSARASFMLAETYDPAILSRWGTYGTRGQPTKARELYAKAHAGGITEARDRLNALR